MLCILQGCLPTPDTTTVKQPYPGGGARFGASACINMLCGSATAEAQAAPLLVDAVNATGSPAAAPTPQAGALADLGSSAVEQAQVVEQCSALAVLPGADISSPTQRAQSEGEAPSPGSAADKRSDNPNGSQDWGGGGNSPAAAVAEVEPPIAKGDLDTVLSLLLPGLAIAAGPQQPTAAVAAPAQAPSAAPAEVEAAAGAADTAPRPASASAPAARSVEALRLGRNALAAPQEQRERLRAFVYEQLWSADVSGVLDGPLAHSPAGEVRVTDAGLCEGGLAERLFRRMGSTPAAAALLRALVCPITKVSYNACL